MHRQLEQVVTAEIEEDLVLAPPGRMSEPQFERWSTIHEKARCEWVDGEVIAMSPPSSEHVILGNWLVFVLNAFVQERDLGLACGPELMIRLAGQKRQRLPDVLYVSKRRLGIVKTNHVEGAPDLIMEIVSPESVSRDWRVKYGEYERAGVREYWVIDPASRRVEAYALGRKGYVQIELREGKLHSRVVRGFYLRPEWLWPGGQPTYLAALRELGVA